MPEAVNIVTGNQTAKAMIATAENSAEGDKTIVKGIQAVAGIGPTTFSNGIPQYRAWGNHPMQMPLSRATATPRAYPPRRSLSECQVLSKRSARSSTRLCNTAAGPGKYGNGSQRKPEVITSQKQRSKTAAATMGHMCRSQRRSCEENGCTAAATTAEPRMAARNSE